MDLTPGKAGRIPGIICGQLGNACAMVECIAQAGIFQPADAGS